jgi:hypothetical protein
MRDLTIFTTYQKADPPSPIEVTGARFGAKVVAFAVDEPFVSYYQRKILLWRKALEAERDGLVAYVDGRDVVMIRPPEDLCAAYDRVCARQGVTVVLAADADPWPFWDLRERQMARAEKYGARTRYCHICAGLIMGPRIDVIGVLDAISRELPRYYRELGNHQIVNRRRTGPKRRRPYESILGDDQGLFALAMDDGSISIGLDYNCELMCSLKGLRNDEFAMSPGRFQLKDGTRPCLVHGNGHGRVHRDRLVGILRFLGGKR